MKNVWVVFQCENDKGRWAFYKRIRGNENLLNYARLEMVTSMNIADTESTAKRYVEYWNSCFIKNGTANKFMVA